MDHRKFHLHCLALLALCVSPVAQAEINVRTNPGYMALGDLNIEIDLPLGDRWSLGPTLTLDAMLEDYVAGLRLNRFRQARTDNGWHTGLAIRYQAESLALNEPFYAFEY